MDEEQNNNEKLPTVGKLSEFIGNKKAIEDISMTLSGVLQRNEVLGHILISGQPGLGKTTIARIIANQSGKKLHTFLASSIQKKTDMSILLLSLEEGDILFIDEIHSLPKDVAESLYDAMEYFRLNIYGISETIGSPVSSFDLPRFTFIGATTAPESLSIPFRQRFINDIKLVPYSDDELNEIALYLAEKLNMILVENVSGLIANRSRGTPRLVKKFLFKLRDYALSRGVDEIDNNVVSDYFERESIESDGLNEEDKRYINILKDNFHGRHVGIKTIASMLGVKPEYLEAEVEPFLMKNGYIERTSRGRILKKDYKNGEQTKNI